MLGWAIFLGFCWGLYKLLKLVLDKPKSMFCRNCGYSGKVYLSMRGSGLIEVFLWLMFIIPGVIYSLWRSSSRFYKCPSCESQGLIPAEAPFSKQ